jgi:hypothetical protein
LKRFGKKTPAAIKRYREFVEGESPASDESPFAAVTGQLVLGSDEFTERIRKLIVTGGKKIDVEIQSGKKLMRWSEKEADEAIRDIAEKHGVAIDAILVKGGHGNVPREASLAEFHRHSRWRLSEIGNKFEGFGVRPGKLKIGRSLF